MQTTLHTEVRAERGKNPARRLRRNGRIPGVLYGGSDGQSVHGSVSVSVDPSMLSRILHSDSGVNTLIELTVDSGEPSQVLIKDYQLDPVTNQLLHVDFYRVAMDKVITVDVPFELKGEAKGVKLQGGLVEFVQRELAVECLPTDIPGHIEVDISDLMIGQGVRVRDLLEGVSWKSMTAADTLIVHVIAPKVEETPEEETEEGVVEEAGEVPEGQKEEAAVDAGAKTGD